MRCYALLANLGWKSATIYSSIFIHFSWINLFQCSSDHYIGITGSSMTMLFGRTECVRYPAVKPRQWPLLMALFALLFSSSGLLSFLPDGVVLAPECLSFIWESMISKGIREVLKSMLDQWWTCTSWELVTNWTPWSVLILDHKIKYSDD